MLEKGIQKLKINSINSIYYNNYMSCHFAISAILAASNQNVQKILFDHLLENMDRLKVKMF